jgi:glycosyltransferase involved in cell wall biosynthesis
MVLDNRLSLEFLIPTYCRLDTAIKAVQSILEQQDLLPEDVVLQVRLQDDASPGLSDEEFNSRTNVLPQWVRRSRNPVNLGMSANIFSMLKSSSADFCTVLTDDDSLHPGVLGEIAEELLGLRSLEGGFEAAGLFVPRYSYLEDGSLNCIVCQPSEADCLILPSPEGVMRFAKYGFILTGLFVKPEKIDYALWHAFLPNAFFPVIYFGALLQVEPVAYRNRNWFRHTVLNLCHWDAWGTTNKQRRARLCHDYLEALALLRRRSLDACSLRKRSEVHQLTRLAYGEQINDQFQYFGPRAIMEIVPKYLFLQLDFIVALAPFLRNEFKHKTKSLLARRWSFRWLGRA